MIILAILFAVLGFLIFPGNAYAEFTFTVPQTTITSDQEIDIPVILSLQGQNNKTYYLEGAFKKEGSSNYFGLTWNNVSWIKYTASNFTTLKPITTDQTGKWSGIVKVKIDKDSSLFTNDGTYTLRLKRFTTGGSYYWADNSISLIISLSSSAAPTPSPILTPTFKPSPAAVSTPNPSFAAATSASPQPAEDPIMASNQPASSDKPKPSEFDSPAFAFARRRIASSSYRIASVAGITASAATATPEAEIHAKNQRQTNFILWAGIIFVLIGISTIGYIYLKRK